MSVMVLNSLKEKVQKKIDELQMVAKVKFGKVVPNVVIRYDLTSIRTAGMAITSPFLGKFEIRLHPAALLEYKDDYIEDTVVHEFAHLVQKQHFVNSQPHGNEWKRVMISFGKDPQRCHNMNLGTAISNYNSSLKGAYAPVKTRTTKTFTYKCGCQEHELTSIRHNKVLKGTGSYRCNKCGQKLVRK